MRRPKPLQFDPIAEAKKNWDNSGWEDASLGMAMVTSVIRAHQILLANVQTVLSPFGLTFAQFEALRLLAFSRTGRIPLGKMGARLQVHPASVTNVVDRLEAKGLVERIQHPHDLRTTLAAITRTGRGVTAKATDALNTQVFRRSGLDDDLLQSLIDGITELRRTAGDFTE